MLVLLTIFQYLVQASVDVTDKFLITKRKIEPLNYTFFTVIFGVLLAVIWPWVYASISFKAILFDVGAGIWFTVAYYIFYRALSVGEVSRVVPFVWGLVPVFDIIFQSVFRLNLLTTQEIAAMFLLVPGAFLITYNKGKFSIHHVANKLLAAAMLSSYNVFWHFSSASGPFFNNLIWNRVGAAAAVSLLLLFPAARKKIFGIRKVTQKTNAPALFLVKQVVGGANFIFFSFLISFGQVPVVDALQGFRYIFLFIGSIVLSKHNKHILDEQTDSHVFHQKLFAIVLICLGTLILFV